MLMLWSLRVTNYAFCSKWKLGAYANNGKVTIITLILASLSSTIATLLLRYQHVLSSLLKSLKHMNNVQLFTKPNKQD